MEETTTTRPRPDENPEVTATTPPTAPDKGAAPEIKVSDTPKLTLWELMRKDVTPVPPDDDTDRVLTNLRPSIWDL